MTDEERKDRSTRQLVARLVHTAAGQDLRLRCAVDTGRAPTPSCGPRVDVSADLNVVTFWLEREESVRVEASIELVSWPCRVDTDVVKVPLNDATIGLFVALLRGAGKITHGLIRRRERLIVSAEGVTLSLPIRGKGPLDLNGPAARVIAERWTRGLVERLAVEATRQDVQCRFAVSAVLAFDDEFTPRVDVVAAGNTLTFWAFNDKSFWVQASVGHAYSGKRLRTVDDEVLVNDATIRLLVGLLKGQGRVVHVGPRAEVLVVGEGRARLSLRVDRQEAAGDHDSSDRAWTSDTE